jgi:membrane protease YdiL (CAAX protease family)
MAARQMPAPIPFLEPAVPYVTAAVTLLCLSCGTLAALGQQVGSIGRRVDFLTTYVITMALVAGFAVIVLGTPTLITPSGATLILAVPVGIIGALAAAKADGMVRSSWRRRSRATTGSHGPSVRPRRVTGLDRPFFATGREVRSPSQGAALAVLLVLAGALEEVLYRGVLVDLVRNLESEAFVVLGLMAITGAFALSHIELGWEEVFAKVPLAIVTLVSVLALDHVLPAVLTHALFNARVWILRSEQERALLRYRLS